MSDSNKATIDALFASPTARFAALTTATQVATLMTGALDAFEAGQIDEDALAPIQGAHDWRAAVLDRPAPVLEG